MNSTASLGSSARAESVWLMYCLQKRMCCYMFKRDAWSIHFMCNVACRSWPAGASASQSCIYKEAAVKGQQVQLLHSDTLIRMLPSVGLLTPAAGDWSCAGMSQIVEGNTLESSCDGQPHQTPSPSYHERRPGCFLFWQSIHRFGRASYRVHISAERTCVKMTAQCCAVATVYHISSDWLVLLLNILQVPDLMLQVKSILVCDIMHALQVMAIVNTEALRDSCIAVRGMTARESQASLPWHFPAAMPLINIKCLITMLN